MTKNRTVDELLTAMPGHYQGTTLTGMTSVEYDRLAREGLIGPLGGLTRKGSIKAERLQNADLDRLFG